MRYPAQQTVQIEPPLMCRYGIKNVIATKAGIHPDSQSLTDG